MSSSSIAINNVIMGLGGDRQFKFLETCWQVVASITKILSLKYCNLLRNECFDIGRIGQRQAFDVEELFPSVANNAASQVPAALSLRFV